MQFYKHGSYNGIAVLQCELRRVTGVTSVSYLGPLSTNIFEPRYKKCAQPVCTIFFSRSAVCCVFLYKRLGTASGQPKQQTADRNVFAWPPCKGRAIASWTLSFNLYFYMLNLPHFEHSLPPFHFHCLLLLNLPLFHPFVFSPRS